MKTKLMALASLALPLSAAALTPEEYCDPNVATPASVREMQPLADGVSYSCISDDEKQIEIYSYKTGKKTGVLFDLDDLKGDVKIASFDGYEVSADGRKLLVWNDSQQIYRNSFTAEYYVFDVARRTLTKVSEGGPQRGAVLSHDGRMVAYQRDNNIFIANTDYRTDVAVTNDGAVNSLINGTPDWAYEEEFGVLNTMRWNDSDTVLAFMKFDESQVPAYSFDKYPSFCDSDPDSDLYPESYSYKYPLAGYPNSVVSLYAYNVDTRVTKKMGLPLRESDYIPSVEFIPGQDTLMAMVLNRDQNHLVLYKVGAASTVADKVLEFRSSAWLAPQAYRMVDYSGKSFVIGSDESGWRHLCEYDYDGRLLRRLTSGDFNVTAYYGFDPRRKIHYVQTTVLGAVNRNVCAVDAKGRMTVLNNAEGTENADFSSDFNYWLRSWSDVTTPPQYTICNASGKKIVEVEMNREYAARYASAPKMKLLKVRNAAGEEMNGYMILPPDFSESGRYPLMMYQYGGPDSQEVLNKWRMEGVFYIASKGYVVAAVDGRGTGNRSRAWATAVYRQLGKYETADQLAGAAWFASLPYVDESRTSCFGWSYGGYMTLMELSAPECRFSCGVSMAPVTDWRFYDSIYTERYMLTPQQNESGYNTASALLASERMEKPLLIMSGTSDDNVHFYNTLRYTSALSKQGKLYDMMALAGFDHSLRPCGARVRLFQKIADYLDRNLK